MASLLSPLLGLDLLHVKLELLALLAVSVRSAALAGRLKIEANSNRAQTAPQGLARPLTPSAFEHLLVEDSLLALKKQQS